MIYAGSRAVAAAYMGSTPLSEIYLGEVLVWAGRRKPGSASMRLWLAEAADGTALVLVATEAGEAIPLRQTAQGEAAALVDVSVAHSIPLAQSAAAEALGIAEGEPLGQLLALVMTRPAGVALVLHPLAVEQDLALTMIKPTANGLTLWPIVLEQSLGIKMPIPAAHAVTLHPVELSQDQAHRMVIPTAHGLVLNPITLRQALAGKMTIPSAQGLVLNPLTLTQAAALTMTIPSAQGVALNPVTAQQAVTGQFPAAEGADITVVPGQADQGEPLAMRAAGEAVEVAPGAADHVLPPVVDDIAPEVLTAEDAAAPESIALAVSAEVKVLYPRFVQSGDTVYIYRPKRWRQEGGAVYLDYEDTPWEAPEEDGDYLIVRQIYSATENGDYLEVT